MSTRSTFGPLAGAAPQAVEPTNLPGRKRRASAVQWLLFAATAFAILVLAALIWDIASAGWNWLSIELLRNGPSRRPERAGLQPALLGTLWIVGLTALFAFPIGIGAAVYLEEYAPDNRWTRLLKTNIANLAGVPSVVYGLLGLGVFVSMLAFDRTLLSGACAAVGGRS